MVKGELDLELGHRGARVVTKVTKNLSLRFS